MRNPAGSSIVEIIVAIGMATLVITSIGMLIVTVNQVDRVSAHRDQAYGYAREALELVSVIADRSFACTSASCACTKAPGYASCWESCPLTIPSCTAATVYHVEEQSGAWRLAMGNATVGTSLPFTRALTLAAVGGDPAVKKVTATVTWTERGTVKSVTQETTVSGWRNVTP